jgi:2,3-bisphosphoglycerate-dependent phosphoglycerate mutase
MDRLGDSRLVLIRHGESEWNVTGLATGWADVSLTARGREQARMAGLRLAADGTHADVVFTSTLRRAQQTAACLLDVCKSLAEPPVIACWQLNERHVGQLQGLDKEAIRHRWGNTQRRRWRSELDALPPPLHRDDPRHPRHDARFDEVPRALVPGAETIADLRRRVLACWRDSIVPRLRAGSRVMVVAHRDSLRVLIAELDGLDAGAFPEIHVPPASPRTWHGARDLNSILTLSPCADRVPAATAALTGRSRVEDLALGETDA